MTHHGDILNEAEVDFLLKGAEEIAETPAADLDDGTRTVTMHGDLDQISLADIFQTLGMSKMEGVLRVRNPLEERQVWCSDGFVRILVPQRLTLRRLGQRLIQAGLLQPDQLRSALVEQRKERVPLGELLVRDGIVEQDAIDEIIGMQVAEDLFALFTWRHGSFEFYKGDPAGDVLKDQFAHCPEYEINSLLLEVARRSDEWETILEEIENLDEVPQQIAQPASPDDLTEDHEAVLAGIDGRSTYRQLSDQTTIGLFDFARAARDLVAGGIIAPIDDPGLVGIAEDLVAEGEPQLAIVLLQTLRDRSGDRSLGVIKAMADVLGEVGERKFASQLLLEAAQRCPQPEEAMELARKARTLSPYDAATLSFLRTVLVAHAAPDSEELEKVTTDLLDALIDADLAETALEVLADARLTDTMRPQLLTREARARQKTKDIEGAINCLSELARHYLDTDRRDKAIEAYEAVLRLDRSKKDVARQLAALKRTRLGKIVRAASALVATGLIGAMGLAWWQQSAFEANLAEATAQVQQLLDQGEREAARAAFDRHRSALGDCEAMQDLGSRVAFAEAAERNRLEKERRSQLTARLTLAAETLGRGDLTGSLTIYGELHGERGMAREVSDVVGARLDALLESFTRAAKALQQDAPAAPDTLLDRRSLGDNIAKLERLCPPSMLHSFEELETIWREGRLPTYISKARTESITAVLEACGETFQQARSLSDAYAAALEQNATQRRLDPMFKAAVDKEKAFDFAGALQLYRQLEQQPTGDSELRAHFRDRVTRNATITRLLDELDKATKAGRFQNAQQHLRALQRSFPEVPFEQLVQLPLMVKSIPTGATVRAGDAVVGKTPVVLSRVPSEEVAVVVEAPGFAPATQLVGGDETDTWLAQLERLPTATWQHDSVIDSLPVRAPDGELILVDRAGRILKRSADLTAGTWEYRTDDLSGWLTTPVLSDEFALVASLDGTLRAIDLARGTLEWQLDGLPCEVQPVLVEDRLILATTDGRLHAIDLAKRSRTSIDLPEPACGRLWRHRDRVLVIGERGTVTGHSVPALEQVLQVELDGIAGPTAALRDGRLIVGDDQGQLRAIDAVTGALLWQRSLDTSTLGSFVTGDHTLMLSTPERLLRFDIRNGKDLSAFPRGDRDWGGTPTVSGQRLIVPLRDGPLQVLDLLTGATTYRLPGNASSHVLAVPDGTVLVSNSDHAVRTYARLP